MKHTFGIKTLISVLFSLSYNYELHAQPIVLTHCPGSNITISSSVTGAVYQWQRSTDGTTYTNLLDTGNYSGTQSSSLQLINLPSSHYGNLYRCIVDGVAGNPFLIRFVNNWTGNIDTLWTNPANWSCGQVPDSNTDAVIGTGRVVMNSGSFARNLFIEKKEEPRSAIYFASSDSLIYSADADSGFINWTFKANNFSVSSPTYSDGFIYVGNRDSCLYALDATKGTLKWKFATGGQIVSSPFLKDSIIYFGSNDGYVHALNVKTVTEKWNLKIGSQAYGSPAVSDSVLYIVGTGSNNSVLIAIDIGTGIEKWRLTATSPFSDVRVRGDRIFFGNSRTLTAANSSTGNSLWNFTTLQNSIFRNPVVISNVVVDCSDSLYAFETSTGAKRWSYSNGQPSGLHPTASDSLVFQATTTGLISAVRLSDGSEKWQTLNSVGFGTNPTFANGNIYVGGFDSHVYVFDALTGLLKRKVQAGNIITSSTLIVLKTGEVHHSAESGY